MGHPVGEGEVLEQDVRGCLPQREVLDVAEVERRSAGDVGERDSVEVDIERD